MDINAVYNDVMIMEGQQTLWCNSLGIKFLVSSDTVRVRSCGRCLSW